MRNYALMPLLQVPMLFWMPVQVSVSFLLSGCKMPGLVAVEKGPASCMVLREQVKDMGNVIVVEATC